ncbi:ABC transporter ATP-binding protein [Reinekea marinisedimentorum]|uniref:Putative spermidine/putrescine transport system ATP-binding protein n=1 Tax=Reinekea marinisedimentorum TaxID=230495 RepID=A0A4R3I3T2_9GAMM|nr:ATP-binding cassette domain-containing protein [Reinekea marinisedimentorum]TCS40376.1 putative spermidine/putrescine transport system ATP-binding protein [Reinekea marinisedimentorum]
MSNIQFESVQCRLLKNISFSIEQGESVALMGPSGSGKSTLLKVAAGLLAYKGRAQIGGASIDKLPRHKAGIGYLSQDLHLFPHLNVENNIRLALLFGMGRKISCSDRIAQSLALARATHLAKLKPAELSGGERQRAALARTIARQPNLLLLDEPFSSLDAVNKKDLWFELKQLQTAHCMTMIVVSHDIEEASFLADRILYLRGGELTVEQASRYRNSANEIQSLAVSQPSNYYI